MSLKSLRTNKHKGKQAEDIKKKIKFNETSSSENPLKSTEPKYIKYEENFTEYFIIKLLRTNNKEEILKQDTGSININVKEQGKN
jgi:hypothetical protein